MKKLWCGMICFLLLGCSTTQVVDPNEENYQEVLAIEKTMQNLKYFKMKKHEDVSYLNCEGDLVLSNEGFEDIDYRFQYDGKLSYIATTKVSDEIQYVTQYYRDGMRYTIYSQMPNDIQSSEIKEDENNVFFDVAIKGVDLQFFTVEKEENEQGILYTLTLEDEEGYNETYPEDYDNATCDIVGDYQTQEIVIQVNMDGALQYIEVKQTITYDNGDTRVSHDDVKRYDYYDLGVEDTLDFSKVGI